MKRTGLILLILLATSLAAMAQSGLEVDKVFSTYGHAKGCKMVEMHDATLRGYKLHVYKSLTYKSQGQQISAILKGDRAKAKKIREIIENGNIKGGYYMMAPQGGLNRYVLFNNGAKGRGAVIYIEGKLSPEDIMKICYTR